MKHLITLLFFVTALTVYGQSKKKIEKETIKEDTFVKTAYPTEVKFCGLMPTSLYLSKKRVIFTSPEVSFDITITKRTKSAWYGRDSGTNYMMRYMMKDNSPVLVFIPEVGSQKLGVMISRTQICD